MRKTILITFLVILMQVGMASAGNDWLVREIKHENTKGKGHTENKGYGFGHNRQVLVLFLDGKIKGGNTETCGEVPTPSENAVITTYPSAEGSRPTLIKRVVEPGIGVVSDGYSDGSTDVFCYDSNGKLSQVTNTETGLKIFFPSVSHEFTGHAI